MFSGVKNSSAIVMIVILIDVNDVGCTHTHSHDLFIRPVGI